MRKLRPDLHPKPPATPIDAHIAHIDKLQHGSLTRTRKKARLLTIAGNKDSASHMSTRGKHTAAVRERDKPLSPALDDDIANRVFVLAVPEKIETDAQDLMSRDAPSLGESRGPLGDYYPKRAAAGVAHRTVPVKERNGGAGHDEVSRRQGDSGESNGHLPFVLGNFFRPIECWDRGFAFCPESEVSTGVPSRSSGIFKLSPRSMKRHEDFLQWDEAGDTHQPNMF
jgi:hypothetical protein